MTKKIFTQDQMLDVSEAKVRFPEGEVDWFEICMSNFTNEILDSVVIINQFDNNDLYEVPASWVKAVR